MADERITAQDEAYVIVCMVPDVCFTGTKKSKGYPLPFVISHKMDQSEQCSDNVFVNDKPVYLHGLSYVDNVKGDEAGGGGGVVTGVNVEISHSLQKSAKVFVNGHAIVRTGDTMHMNTSKP